jgi:hypothetical protein
MSTTAHVKINDGKNIVYVWTHIDGGYEQIIEYIQKIISKKEKDDDTGKPLFWSNDMGWVDRADATIFTAEEKESMNLPTSGRWMIAEQN